MDRIFVCEENHYENKIGLSMYNLDNNTLDVMNIDIKENSLCLDVNGYRSSDLVYIIRALVRDS